MEKGYCIIKEVNELRKADALNAEEGREGEGVVGETCPGNCSHSSMSGVVRRRPLHGDNCSRRTSSPRGHWNLAHGRAVTCASHPGLGSLSEKCTCQHQDPRRFCQKPTSQHFSKGGPGKMCSH